jgi:hypothetical protein
VDWVVERIGVVERETVPHADWEVDWEVDWVVEWSGKPSRTRIGVVEKVK